MQDHDHDGVSRSVWMDSARPVALPPLERDVDVDVCVVGAGITGLSAAFLIAREGRSVVVLDDGTVGGGQTKRTTAHLASALDDRFTFLERVHGAEGARLAAESHAAAIDTIETIAREESIDCRFERLDGFLVLGPDAPPDLLDRELEAAHRAGLRDAERLEHTPLASLPGPCLRFPRQAQLDPLRYLEGLERALRGRGGQLFQAHATAVEGGAPARVRTAGGREVTARYAVVATNSPVNDRVTMHTKQFPYRTFVIAATVPQGSVPRALYWDTLDPYHYVRLARPDGVAEGERPRLGDDEELLIVGGEDERIGGTSEDDAARRYGRLEAWTRRRFPMLRDVVLRWSGEVIEPVDGLAYIGQNPGDARNVLIATGDSGQGMTHGTIAGLLLRDLVAGRSNAWASLYDPSRKPFRNAREYARENLQTAAHYAAWLDPRDTAVASIARGSGAVVRRGLDKIAVYRDDAGTLHERSAVCPHLGGLVAWNGAEKTWDCPCHGSRFDRFGRVVQGPANSDLSDPST